MQPGAKPWGRSLQSLQKASKEVQGMRWGTEQTTRGETPAVAPVQSPAARLPSPYPHRGGVAILRKERIHLKKELSSWCSDKKFPARIAFQQKIKLVTPDTLCGGICWVWKLWTFRERNKNVGIFSQKPNGNVTFSEGQLCREDIQVCAGSRARTRAVRDLLTFSSAFLPGGVWCLCLLGEPSFPWQQLTQVC